MKTIKKEEIKIEAGVDTANKLLRVYIDANWTSDEFAILFKSINDIYNYNFTIAIIKYLLEKQEALEIPISSTSSYFQQLISVSKEFSSDWFTRYDHLYNKSETHGFIDDTSNLYFSSLYVKKIQYSSPGSVDFIGLGKVLEVIKELIVFYIPNEKTKMEIEKLKIEMEILKQQKNKMLLKNMKELGFDKKTIQEVFMTEEKTVGIFKELIVNKKIIDANIIEEN